jgi:hypothetical protein
VLLVLMVLLLLLALLVLAVLPLLLALLELVLWWALLKIQAKQLKESSIGEQAVQHCQEYLRQPKDSLRPLLLEPLVLMLERTLLMIQAKQSKESSIGEQAVQHCLVSADDPNRVEQARHHEHPRTALLGQREGSFFPSVKSVALRMH